MSATRADTYTNELIEEHKGSAIGNHLREQHDMESEDIDKFTRKKCKNIIYIQIRKRLAKIWAAGILDHITVKHRFYEGLRTAK